VGDGRPRRRSGEQVAEHSEGEGEQSLGDALDQAADGADAVAAGPSFERP
jgi:hypothetical protein